ncbi:MAG: hypothetical protein IPG68_07640 [Micrococcales bacterium]|nr:hypothetical protein [Micrococcales bacterium]
MLVIPAVEGELPDPSEVGPGLGALAVFVFLLIAGVFLMRSMRKQLRRVDFPEDAGPDDPDKPVAS